MRVKIMLPLLWLLGYRADRIVGSETGSRSSSSAAAGAAPASVTNRGQQQQQQQQQASARERDFRPSSPWPDPTSVYKSADIGDEHLIGGRVTFFTPDDFIWKRRSVAAAAAGGRRRKKKNWPREEPMKTWNSETRPGGRVSRNKRSAGADWIDGDVDRSEDFLRMHAFIVRDEDVPDCGNAADKVTKTRYFMCSGVILNEKHVLTSATCMNRAQIYEHHIDAELAVLIGALEENSYVIKIAHYEIHPHYVPDPNSIHHATYNVAVLTLSCSISLKSAVIPKLPSNAFDDVGHMCCPDRCKLLTVIENSNNQHIIKKLQIKHLPSPRHTDDDHDDGNDEDFMVRSFKKGHKNRKNSRTTKRPTSKQLGRKVRNPEKTPPQYFTKGVADKMKAKDLETGKKESSGDDSTAALGNADIGIDWELIKKEIMANDVTTENKEKLANFMKNSMSDIITKILESMTRHVARIDNAFPFFKNILKKNTPSMDDKINEKISDLMGKKILKLALKELYIIPKEHNDSEDENLKNKGDQLKDTQRNINTGEDDAKATDTKVDDDEAEATDTKVDDDDKSKASDTKVDDNEAKETKTKVDDVDSKTDLAGTDSNSDLKTDTIATTKNEKEATIEVKPSNTDDDIAKPNDINDTTKPEKNSEPEAVLENNVNCPPLGSPIISNNTLVGLIAYTCDDAQSWVEWKYFDVIGSIKWIRTEMTKEYPE